MRETISSWSSRFGMAEAGAPLRVTVVTQDYLPEQGAGPARFAEMARSWQDAGGHIEILTGMPYRRIPGGVDGVRPARYRRKLFLSESIDGLTVHRSWVYTSKRPGLGHTAVNNASFLATSVILGSIRLSRPGVLLASSPPFLCHLAGYILAHLRRVELVLDVRDLWPDYLVGMGILQSDLAQRTLYAMERWLLKRASEVVVVTESFRRKLIAKGVRSERVHVIPNGVDLDFYRPAAEFVPSELLDPFRDKHVVGYVGTMGAGQGLSSVLQAAARLQASGRSDIHFVLVGDGAKKRQLTKSRERLMLENVTILPPIEKSETRRFYAGCHVCLVPLAPLPVFLDVLPSKLFELLASGRPILACAAGETAALIRRSGGGVVAPPDDAGAIASALEALVAAEPDRLARMAAAGRRYVELHYDRRHLADRYWSLLRRVGADN